MATNDTRGEVAIARDAERKEAPRTRPADFGGPRLKLSVPYQIPGMHLFFENDDDNGAIEQLLHEGFTFVTRDEVGLGRGVATSVVADDDVTERVSRFVGKKADGTAMRAYLLKCPDDLWADRTSYRDQDADAREESIIAEQREPSSGRYLPQGVKSSLNSKYRKEY
jgi:hypothetical protein